MKLKQLLFTVIASCLLAACSSSTNQSLPVLTEDLKQPAPKIAEVKEPLTMGDLLKKLNDVILKYNGVAFQIDKIVERVNEYERNAAE